MLPLFCSVQVCVSLCFLSLWICNFPLSLFSKSPFFVKLVTQSYSILLILFLNLFLFLSAFSVFLNEVISDGLLANLLSRFSVLINYIIHSYNIFSVSSCFPSFSGLRFFSSQVFQDHNHKIQ